MVEIYKLVQGGTQVVTWLRGQSCHMQQASELLLGYSIVVSPYVTSNILFKAINIK